MVNEKTNIIDVVAPARADFSMTSQQIKDLVHNFGFIARFPENIVQEGADLLCCNSIENRTRFLIDALSNKESKFVWALSGGYGTTALLSFLDHIDLSDNKKIIVGFSDLTALMIYVIQKYKWPCIHTRTIRGIIEGRSNETEIELLKKCLNDSSTTLAYDLLPFNTQAKHESEIEAETIGGNLSLIQCSLGTNWHIETEDKILLIEDIDEAGYRVDRILVHLEQAKIFDKVKAVIIGDFACKEESELVSKVLYRFFEKKNFPVFKTELFGHGAQNNPFILGVKARLASGPKSKILFNTDF